ncbi:MAG: hypothetical protein EBV06_07625 [Planctomycetia bacterium]|nr:hypothetical protein [Planctomycetia bacterium]
MGYLLIGLMLGMAVLVAVVLILWMIIERAGRQRQSLFQQRGVITDATVESSSLDNGLWEIAYRFHDRHGMDQSGIDFMDAHRNQQPAEGSRIRVVYLPDQPWISGLAQTWLHARASVR